MLIRNLAVVASVVLTASGCKQRESAELLGTIKRSDDRPPAVLYHFGEFGHLQAYGVRNGTFNTNEWNQIGSVGEAQKPYRRGLYVSQHPAYNERYALDQLKAEQSRAPWMLTVQLKAECHNDGRFEGNILKALYEENARFAAFLNRNGEKDVDSVDRFKQLCPADAFSSQAKEQAYLANRQWKAQFERCLAVVDKYFSAENIGVVYDAWWPNQGFWYIRDPSCIERIDGSAEGNLTALANIPDLWQKNPYTDNTPRYALPTDLWGSGEAMFNMLLRAYTFVPNADSTLLNRIESNAVGDVYLAQFVKAAANKAAVCQKQGRFSTFTGLVGGFLHRIATNEKAFRDQVMAFVNSDLQKLDGNCELPKAKPAAITRPAPAYVPPPANDYGRCPEGGDYIGQARSLQGCRNLTNRFCSNMWRSVNTNSLGDCCCTGPGSGGSGGSTRRSTTSRYSGSNVCPSDRPNYVGTASSTEGCFRLADRLGYQCLSVRLLGGSTCCCS